MLGPDEQARLICLAWERLPGPRPSLSFEIALAGGQSQFYNLGPHPPRLWPQDVELTHELWLELGARFGPELHHRDVLGVALRRMEQDLADSRKTDVIQDLSKELRKDR